MSFPRYERYKNSGLEWLGEVPERWEVWPVRSVVRNIDERNDEETQKNYLSLMANIGIIPYESKGDIGNKKPEDLSKCKLVAYGDIVINSMNYSIGSYGISPYAGICSPVYIVMRVNELCAARRFVFRLFENRAFQKYAASFGNGILAHRAAIGWDHLKAIGIPVPPMDEQDQILSFLDEETTKIDSLIQEQQRLIELLKEKRRAVISHAVTKGLDPTRPTKDSEIQCIGRVPEEWKVFPAKRVAKIFVPQRDKPDLNTDGNGFAWITMDNMKDEEIVSSTEWVAADFVQKNGIRVIPVGAVIASCVGNFGICSITRVDAVINQQLQAFLPKSYILSSFLRYCVVNAKSYFDQVGTATTIAYVNQQGFGQMPLTLPPLDEQSKIVLNLDHQNEVISGLTLSAERAITLLQERRAALISAAVTGKIDVRNYRPKPTPAPEELCATA